MLGKPYFDPDLVEWQFDVYEWLFENFGGLNRFRQQTLVTPTPDFFPFSPSGKPSYVRAVFETIKEDMGMSDWICQLIPLDDKNPWDELRKSSPFYGSWESRKSAAGLFQLDQEGARIYYSRSQLANPVSLIATLSHELSHYLISSTVTEPPGGWDDLEPMTDLTSVFRGFGIFLANSTFIMKQWGDYTGSGWSFDSLGYLSESELAFGIAIFCTLNDIPAKPVARFLRPNPRAYFKKAMKEMQFYGDRISRIRSTEPIPR